jgi:phosphoribosyl 1,2-cyclic phosphodiesterase
MSVGPVCVEFHGVRGSTPCAGPQYARYGGHSSCVSITAPGSDPVVFDLGTGLTPYGELLGGAAEEFCGHALLTHLHWDHVQGLPFFTPLHNPESRLDVYAPAQLGGPVGDVFSDMMKPPYFPITVGQLRGAVQFHDFGDESKVEVGDALVTARYVPHVGPTLGFRVDFNGVAIAYVPDHGPGCCDATHDDEIADTVLELCDGADLVIHDAQHTEAEFGKKRDWGHCSFDYAVHVARAAGARRLALFHHCPSHGDDVVDRIHLEASETSARLDGPSVFAAAEGLKLELEADNR